MPVEITDLVMQYPNGFKAINGISLSIGDGVFGLLGQNGAGKTTLMRILVTLLKPTSGTITVNGITSERRTSTEIRRMVGYLPQEVGLHPNLTVFETLDYFGILELLDQKVRKERILRLLEQTNLTEHANKKIKQLSGGMKRRVGLAQAMLNDPALLVVDEPTAGLDPEERIRIRMLLSAFSKGRTVILSTHVVEDIASICNQLTIMEKGTTEFCGTVPELVNAAASHVFTTIVRDDSELIKLTQKYTVTNSIYTNQGVRVRFVSDVPIPEAVQEEPNIEDAYIYVNSMRKKAEID